MRLARAIWAGLAVAAMLGAGACNAIFGIGDYEVGPAGASGGAGGAGASEGAAMACLENEVESCYEGPEGTLDVGVCAAGERVCGPDGSGFGECEGQTLPALEDCASEDDEDCNDYVCGQPLWSRSVTDVSSMESQVVTGVAVTEDAVFICGSFRDSARIGGRALTATGGQDGFVAKLSPGNGTALWMVALHGDNDQQPEGLAVDAAGNPVVVGTFRQTLEVDGAMHPSVGASDIFVVKLDGDDGTRIWSKTYGSTTDDRALAVDVSDADEVAVTGDISGQVDFDGLVHDGTLPADMFVFVADPAGTVQWVQLVGGDAAVYGKSVAFGAREVFVATVFSGTAMVGLQPVAAVAQDGLVVAASAGGILRHAWITGADDQIPTSVRVLGAHVVVAGEFDGAIDLGAGGQASAGATDIFVAKYSVDLADDPAYVLFTNGADANMGSIAVDAINDITVVGGFRGNLDVGGTVLSSAGATDIFVAKLNEALELRFGAGYGNVNDEAAIAVAVTAVRDIHVGGYFFGDLDFDVGVHSATIDDGFIVKMAP